MRYLALLLAFTSIACSKTHSDEAEAASAFIDRLNRDRKHSWGDREAVENQIIVEKLDKAAVLRGSLKLLNSRSPGERSKAAYLLGRLGDKSAVLPLIKALESSDSDLRVSICYALNWLGAASEPAESALVKLCREDPSLDVRVAAAHALGRPTAPDAIAAFELGARTTKDSGMRRICEDALEKIGKLQLPLPDDVYTQTNESNLETIKSRAWRTQSKREVRKGDILYFEFMELYPDGIQGHYYWYKMQVEPKKPGDKK